MSAGRAPVLVAAAALLSATSVASAQTAPSPRLEVAIESPHGGVVEGPIVRLEAIVSDPAVRHATLVVNGAAYDAPVEQGRVTQEIVAVPGNNRVGLVARNGSQVARDSVTFRYEGEAVDLVVLLTWQTRGEIIDLWVREPGGETCKWDHRQTGSGGQLLDFSANAIGFGSQAYTLSEARAGTFRIKFHYWGAFAEDDARGWYSYDELVWRLDELEDDLSGSLDPAARAQATAERDRTRSRLDQWATPAPPQVQVHAEAVLFPGTRAERRWRFDQVAQRTGQLVTLGEIEVTDQMIRAAREEQP